MITIRTDRVVLHIDAHYEYATPRNDRAKADSICP